MIHDSLAAISIPRLLRGLTQREVALLYVSDPQVGSWRLGGPIFYFAGVLLSCCTELWYDPSRNFKPAMSCAHCPIIMPLRTKRSNHAASDVVRRGDRHVNPARPGRFSGSGRSLDNGVGGRTIRAYVE